MEIGKRLHPENVYESEKVRLHVGDARTFLRNPEYSNYDMIVFGALDTHSVFSSMSSLRLDNYVYTLESFSQAMDRLGPSGIVAVTFYALRQWQLERVYNALWAANGWKPVIVRSLGEGHDNLVMLAGPGINRDQLLQHPYVVEQNAEDLVGQRNVEPTTDVAVFVPAGTGFSDDLRVDAAPPSCGWLYDRYLVDTNSCFALLNLLAVSACCAVGLLVFQRSVAATVK